MVTPFSLVSGISSTRARLFLFFGFGRSGLLKQTAAPFFLQSITVAADRDDMTVVKQAVENGGGHDGIAKHGAPLADAAIAGEQDCTALVTAADKLKEEMRGVRFKRQVSEFVEDEQLWLAVGDQPVLEPALRVSLGKARDEHGCRYKQNRVAGNDRLARQGDCQMGLADAGRSQEKHVLPVS